MTPKQNKGVLQGRIRSVTSLRPSIREAMWALFSVYYEDIERAQFFSDLDAKSDIVLVEDRDSGELRGFSTLMYRFGSLEGRAYQVVFSGDTIIDKRYWGQRVMQRRIIQYMVQRKLAAPRTKLYWLLTSKGYKTYLLLTRNCPVHWPRHETESPVWERALMDRLGDDFFGDAWCPDLGIVRHDVPCGRLRGSVAPLDERTQAMPEVAFFCTRNPQHAEGDELLCIGQFDRQTVWHFGKRQLKRAFRKRKTR